MFNGARYKVKDAVIESIVITKESVFPKSEDDTLLPLEIDPTQVSLIPFVRTEINKVNKERDSDTSNLSTILKTFRNKQLILKVITFPILLIKVVLELIKIYKSNDKQ